jgi:hypothetical protein
LIPPIMAATEGNPMQIKVYGFSSNARRAARAAGLDPNQVVKQNPHGLGFVMAKRAADDFPDLPATAARKKTNTAKNGDNTALLISMLKSKGGASVEQLTKATGWLPHTLRARISRLANPPHKMKVTRDRNEGVTRYRLGAS